MLYMMIFLKHEYIFFYANKEIRFRYNILFNTVSECL